MTTQSSRSILRLVRIARAVAVAAVAGITLAPAPGLAAAPAIYNLGTLLGGTYSGGSGVNDAGQVTGSGNFQGGLDTHAFRYDGTPGSDGVMHDLGTLGGADASAEAINDSGQVTGGSSFIPGDTLGSHAFRYDGTPGSGGVMRNLGTLGGSSSRGYGINNAGQVTGNSLLGTSTANDPTHAFLYTGTPGAGGVMHDLGTLGGMQSQGIAINNAGQVVGWSEITGSTIKHPFLYTGTPGVDGQMIDLDAWLDTNNPAEGAKWTLFDGIPQISISSNTRWITGVGVYDADGPGGIDATSRAFLLDATSLLVPEPSSIGLLAFSAPALVRLQLRRRRREGSLGRRPTPCRGCGFSSFLATPTVGGLMKPLSICIFAIAFLHFANSAIAVTRTNAKASASETARDRKISILNLNRIENDEDVGEGGEPIEVLASPDELIQGDAHSFAMASANSQIGHLGVSVAGGALGAIRLILCEKWCNAFPINA
jgi:probable HAF family extracellular repeat protein